MEEGMYRGITKHAGRKFLAIFIVLLGMTLASWNAQAQTKRATIEWKYTLTTGLSCKYPMLIRIYYSLSDGSNYDFLIFKNPSYPSYDGYPYVSGNSFSVYMPDGVTFTTLRIAAGYYNNAGLCPSMPSSGICYSGGVFEIARNHSDPCVWPVTAPSPLLCGLSDFQVKVNISPSGGGVIVQQGTVKPVYCPDENITFEVPCGMKGQGWTFNWYYREGTGSFKLLKTTTSETITVGQGQDYTPKPNVNTFLYVTGKYGSSEISGAFRYGARPPTAIIDPKSPLCADGDDWYIDITNANSAEGYTDFKANIFHPSNASIIPDGAVDFTGPSGQLKKVHILSGRVFVPGATSFTMTLQTQDGACVTPYGPFIIPNKARLTASEITASHKDLSCFNTLTGEFQLNVSNGDGNYTVQLGGTGYPIKAGSPANQPIIEKLDGGTYSVKVYDTHCEAAPITVTLSEPEELTASIEVIKGLECFNSVDGQLKVNIDGGIEPYAIHWSNGNTSVNASGFGKGTHSVDVTDQGCPTLSPTQALTAPDPMIITLEGTSPKCPDGDDGRMKVTSLQNAPGVIEYSWNVDGNTDEIIGLIKGTYTVTITSRDAGKTCIGTASKLLEDPLPWTADIKPVLAYNGSVISCNGKHDGRLEVVVKNDLGAEVDGEYYTWSTGENGTSVKFIGDLAEATYTIAVRYRGVCEAKDSYALLDPEPVTATILPNIEYNGQLISCHDMADASIKAAAIGGTGLPAAFTYTWNTGLKNTILSGIGAGGYGIKVTDLNGCVGRDTITIGNPEPVEALILSHSDYAGYGVSCLGKSDGYVTADGAGGTGVYSYLWSNGKPAAFNNNLGTGSYTVTVTDNNGCPASIGHTITTPTALTVLVSGKKNVSCFNGNNGIITLQPGGGANGYEYSKDNSIWQSSATFNTLKKGAYILYVRDSNNCSSMVGETLTEPTQINIDFTGIEPAYCANPVGTATGVVTGGVGNYKYEWRENGQSAVLGTDITLSNVAAGIYRLYVIDGNDCPADNSVPLTSTDGAKTTFTSVDTKCFDSSDGSALITITEGDGPFVIKWPDGQDELQGDNLRRGDYAVLITDGHGCTVISPVKVKAPDALQLNVSSQTIPTCNTFCDGALTLQAIGGVGGYVYEWNGKTDAAQTQLCAALYPVTLTDANACVLKDSVELLQPGPIAVTVTGETLATCRDGCDGALQIAATGGNGGYQYVWAAGGNTNFKNNICPGDYTIAITDVRGCTGQGIITLHNTAPLPLNLGGGVTLCVGQTHILDAGQWVNTQWGSSTGLSSTQQAVTIKDPGQYWVEVLNDKGCIAQDTFLLETSYDLLRASFMIPQEAVAGDTVVMIDISWPLPDAIEWHHPEAMKKVLDLGDVMFGQFDQAGTYEVGLTAHLGECVDIISKSIVILEAEEGDEGGRLGYEKFVKEFILFPNPNNGSFDVGVELIEASDVTLSVWNSPTGLLVSQEHHNGQKTYRVYFDLRPLTSGTYVLRLDHAKGKEYIRFVVY